jgi:hypothetical protein
MWRYVIGYGVSVVIAIPITYVWTNFLYRKLDESVAEKTSEEKPGRVWWIPPLIGIFERIIITTLIAFSVSGAASFIGTWIAVKIAGGWITWSKGTTYGRGVLFVSLLGSAMSVLFALVGGIICQKSVVY